MQNLIFGVSTLRTMRKYKAVVFVVSKQSERSKEEEEVENVILVCSYPSVVTKVLCFHAALLRNISETLFFLLHQVYVTAPVLCRNIMPSANIISKHK